MAIQTGIGCRAFLHGYDISADVNSFTADWSQELADTTSIMDGAHRRTPVRNDGKISFNGFFNPSDLVTPDKLGQHQAYTVLGKLPTTDRQVMIDIVGGGSSPAIGDPAMFMVAREGNYSVNRVEGNVIATTLDAQADDYGLVIGQMQTAGKVTHASAANGASIDGAAASTTGGISQVQVFSVATGTMIPIAQDSADDSTFAAITGLTHTGVTNVAAPTAETLATATTATIRRYTRHASTGTFTNAVWAAAFRRGQG